MTIVRTYKAQGSVGRIDKPGEYKVTVEKTEAGPSKSGKKMLTITFVTDDEKRIKGYYVRALEWHMKALADCKIALGLKGDSPAELMVGKRCGIAVGAQAPTEDGRTFMQIEGYGKEADVEGHVHDTSSFDDVPF